MFHLPQALRQGFRTLAHTRGLAIVAILSLGVAVNVAVFAVVVGGVIVATIIPAWRAARTPPLTALRQR